MPNYLEDIIDALLMRFGAKQTRPRWGDETEDSRILGKLFAGKESPQFASMYEEEKGPEESIAARLAGRPFVSPQVDLPVYVPSYKDWRGRPDAVQPQSFDYGPGTDEPLPRVSAPSPVPYKYSEEFSDPAAGIWLEDLPSEKLMRIREQAAQKFPGATGGMFAQFEVGPEAEQRLAENARWAEGHPMREAMWHMVAQEGDPERGLAILKAAIEKEGPVLEREKLAQQEKESMRNFIAQLAYNEAIGGKNQQMSAAQRASAIKAAIKDDYSLDEDVKTQINLALASGDLSLAERLLEQASNQSAAGAPTEGKVFTVSEQELAKYKKKR